MKTPERLNCHNSNGLIFNFEHTSHFDFKRADVCWVM